MAGNKDFIEIIREIRGSAAPGQPITNGIWYELTIADKNGNPGIYGDILAKYGVVTESAGTFDQAVAILENLNVEVTTLPAGSQATSALVNGVWQIGIPRGTAGIDGEDGSTPVVTMSYVAGDLKYVVTVNGTQITNTALVDLDGLVDTRVNANVDVQTTIAAKQDVLDSVAEAQGIADGLDANAAAKIVQLTDHTTTKIAELSAASDLEKVEITTHADTKVAEYNANAVTKTHQYNNNHEAKVEEYNTNDTIKLAQYNANHIERLENLDEKYATRIIDMLNTNKILGMVDRFAAKVPTQYATFIDTALGSYIYYLNGTILTETTDYTVINSTTIQMVNAIAYGDVVTQVDSKYIGDYLTFEGVILEERIGQPDGVAGLDSAGKVPAAQLPSYVDDVIEVATYAELPTIGELEKIYVVVEDETSNGDTSSYRWTGSVYAMVSNTLNAADIKALYESNPDVNAFTNAAKAFLDVTTTLQTTAQTLPTAINELGVRIGSIEDNTTLAEYGITDAYTKTEVQETLPAVGFDTTNTTPPTRIGQMRWNQDEGTVDLALPNGVTLQLGQENNRLVRNGTANEIPNMTVCMFAGTVGNSGRILVAPFDGLPEHTNYVYGVATQSIASGEDGYITIEGKVRNVDTTGASVGEVWEDEDMLYAKPNDAGTLTKVEPAANELKMVVASVIKAHTNGTLEVRVLPFNENAYEPKNANIQAHIIDTNNPHSVTAAQVGLSNVDNTSDASKPLSDAAIAALALKLSIATSALCTQVSITDDPNNATQEYILTKHANCPDANVSYWYIHTIFYTAQTNGAPRSQMAYAYTGSNALYNRHYISGAWSAWTRVDSVVVDATSSVKGVDYKGLYTEFTVVDNPTTSINFSGLDINTHKSYRVEIDNVSNGASYIALFVNGDNTQTNYYTQQIFVTSATVVGININASRFGYQAAEDNLATVSATIHKGANGLVTFESLCSCDRNESACSFGRKTGTVTNVTQLTFTHTLTNGFGVGSKIRIYRGDV